MSKRKAKYIVIPFLITILFFFFMNLFNSNKTISVSENRNLEEMPTIEDLKEGNYPLKFEKYYNDQFVFREEMLRINRKLEVKLGKSHVANNYYLVDDNWILGKFPRILNSEELNRYANVINQLSKVATDGGKEVYFALTPHKTNMLKHLYPEFVDNKENININKNSFKLRLNPDIITFLDGDEYMIKKFSTKELEKLYFKTDHHWNGTGAFEWFKLIVENINIGIPKDKLQNHFNSYKIMEYDDKDFVGSYNRNLSMVVEEKEYLKYVYLENQNYKYYLSNGEKDKKVKEENIIGTYRNREKWDYGGAYIRGNVCNILKIKNDNALTDKKILVFRDSYQAPTTLMFADLFSEVQFIDPRNIENIELSYEEIIKNSDSDIIMFMYNSSGFDSMIKNMSDRGIR